MTSEELSLVRDDALDVATALEELAAALRVVALGGAASDDVALLRGNINAAGVLVVEAALDWEFLFSHADDEVGFPTVEGAP